MSTSHRTTRSRRSSTRRTNTDNRPLALVTGATSGLGLAVARDLSQDHDLILLARTEKDLAELAGALWEESRTNVAVLPADLTDEPALAAAVERLGLDSLDLLVHCAGVEAVGTLAELTPTQWHQAMSLNAIAPAVLTQLLLPPLRAARGLVVFINSGAGQHAHPGHGAYCASKHALRAVADCLRQEEAGKVRVTSIYPGRVDTPMQRRIHKLTVGTGNKPQAGRSGRVRGYRPSEHMTPQSVARTVRLAVDMPVDAAVEELTVRPPQPPA